MEHLYGLATVIAWNPWVAYGLLIGAALLRRRRWHGPAYVCAVVVGAAVGLSHPDEWRRVVAPPDCSALDPLWMAVWIALLTFAAEWPLAWRKPDPDGDFETFPPAPAQGPAQVGRWARFQPWTKALRETLLTSTLFLTAAWHPGLFGALMALLGLYVIAAAGIWLYYFARRVRVARRLTAAAAVGAESAAYALEPEPWKQFRRGVRHRQFAVGSLVVAMLVAAANWMQVAPGVTLVQMEIAAAMQNIAQRANAVPPRGEETIGYQLAMEADCLQHIAPILPLWWRLHCAVAQAEFGLDPYPDRRGYFLRTYVSPVDDSPQVYTVYVPDSYDPDQPMPLVVWLHGHIGFRAYQGIWIPYELWTDKAIVIAPQARGSLDYTGLQKNEVAAAMVDVQRLYNIDRSRVYLAGHSMGGTGSWYLATQWPDRIAAIAPSSPNLSPWAWGYVPPSGDPVHDDLAVRLQLNEAAIGSAANLRRMPVLASHSDDDALVPVENSRLMVAALAALHPGTAAPVPQVYLESPHVGIGHGVAINPGRRLDWLLQFRRPQPGDPDGPKDPPAPLPAPPVPAYGPIYRAFDEPFVVIVPDGVRAYADRQPTDNHALALQQIAREVLAFQRFWEQRYQTRPRVLSVSAYLRSKDPRRGTWHPIFLGGPDVNLATAMLLEGDGPFAAWKLPAGIDAREEHLTVAGDTADRPAILYAIVPPAPAESAEAGAPGMAHPGTAPFGVVIAASDGGAYFQALRRYGIQFGSYALRTRIWFDYALCDAQSFDNTRLIRTYGFYGPDGAPDLKTAQRAYHGSASERVLTTGSLWPTPADRFRPWPVNPVEAARKERLRLEASGSAGRTQAETEAAKAAGDAQTAAPATPCFRYTLYDHLPVEVDSDTPLSFNAHAKGEPLRLGGDPFQRGAGGRLCLHGISFGAVGSVAGGAHADWAIPPGKWKLTGRVGPDFAVYPPLVFAALDALHLPGKRGGSSQRPVVGYRVRVDGQEIWVSAQPVKGAGKRGKGATPTQDPPAWQALEYELNLTLPAGKVLSLETFTLRGNPWELPPAVWANVQLERVE